MKNKKLKRTALLLAFAPAFQKFSCATNYSRPASGVGGRREAVSGRGERGIGAEASNTCCRLIRIIWMTKWRYAIRPKTNLKVKVMYPNLTKKKLLLVRKSIYLCLGIQKYNYVRSEKKTLPRYPAESSNTGASEVSFRRASQTAILLLASVLCAPVIYQRQLTALVFGK